MCLNHNSYDSVNFDDGLMFAKDAKPLAIHALELLLLSLTMIYPRVKFDATPWHVL